MRQSTKDVINIVCYIGIFILTVIIIMPPLLRFLLPDGDDFSNTVNLELLTCTKTELPTRTIKVINTHYKNDKVEKIDIQYTNVLENSFIDEKNYFNLSGVDVIEDGNQINITITPNNNNDERLSALFQKIDKQKSIYEDGDYNYTCTITSDK